MQESCTVYYFFSEQCTQYTVHVNCTIHWTVQLTWTIKKTWKNSCFSSLAVGKCFLLFKKGKYFHLATLIHFLLTEFIFLWLFFYCLSNIEKAIKHTLVQLGFLESSLSGLNYNLIIVIRCIILIWYCRGFFVISS